MNTLSRTALSLLAIAGLSIASRAATIKMGSLAPQGSPWDDALRKIAAQWNTVSGGTVSLRIYPGGIAGDEDDMIRKMRIGQLDAAAMSGMGLCRIFTGVLAVQLPLLIRTDEELWYVLEKMRPLFEKKMESEGFVIIMWSKVGWAHFFSQKPVVYPDDLKAQKLFVYQGDPDGTQAWKNAGFHVVPLSLTDLMSSLQSGMVEAFTTTPLSAASYQWFGLAKNMCGMKWAPLLGGIVVSKRAWNRIPAQMHGQLLEVAHVTGNSMQKEIDQADDKAVSVMKQHGLVVSTVPPEAEQAWFDATRWAFEKIVGKSFDRESYDTVKKLLEEIRKDSGR